MQIKNKIIHLKKCKICGNTDLRKIIQLNKQYISATFVKSNKDNSLSKIRSPLTLVLCSKKKNRNSCGHLQLREIINPDLLYRKYFYRSATNDTMRKDLKDVVVQVQKLVKLYSGDAIVDIGSNDCTLLNYYNKKYNLFGFEPARNIKFIDKGKDIKIFKNYFNSGDFLKKVDKKAKIITSCAMFYDLPDPKKFVKDIEKILHEDGIWCVQISYLLSMLKFSNFYDICHEHLSYYSLHTFEKLLSNFNLKCFYAETNSVNGASIRLFVCKKDNRKYDLKRFMNPMNKLRKMEKAFKLDKEETFINFQKDIDKLKNKTNKFVDRIIKKGGTVLALGASTKGNILLQHFGLNKSKIPFISDKNPDKVGLRCLGSDIELISEQLARRINPDAFIVLPWAFKKEIIKREKNYINHGGTLMFPLPFPHVITKKGEKKL